MAWHGSGGGSFLGAVGNTKIRPSRVHGQYFTAGHPPVNPAVPIAQPRSPNDHADDRRLVAPPAAPEATAHRCHAH